MTTSAILDRAAHLDPERDAVSCGGSALTFRELDEHASRVGSALAGLGVSRTDRVAVLMGNRLEYLPVYHGIGRMGAVFVPIVTGSKLLEIEYFLEHSESETLIVDAERWEALLAAMAA